MNVTDDATIQAHLKTLTVLLVEDDEVTRELGAEFLSRLVGVLLTAENGEEGLATYRKYRPDIVITDIQMPVMDGLAMIREIRGGDTHKPVPIFVMTAFEQLEYLENAINLGVYEYVVKPINIRMFMEALMRCARHLLSEQLYIKTQEELVISLNMYAELFDLAPIAYFIFDSEGVIQEANHIGEGLLGIEKQQLIDTPFCRFVANGGDKEIYSLHLENVLRHEGMHKCVIRLSGTGGAEIYGQLQSVAVGVGKSGAIRILSSIVDGTNSEQLKKEVQGALEYAENIVETVREPLVVLNSDLKILTANHSFYETFKVEPLETVGNFIYDVGNRQWDIPALRVLFEEILPKNTVFNNYEVEHDFPGIGQKTILLNGREIFRESIGSHIILLAMEDITERKQLEIKIQNALEYAENIVETVREPMVVLDSDLKVITANHNFYDAFKVSSEDTVGHFIYDLGNRQWDIPKLRILLEEILPQETVLNGYEVEHDFPDIGRKTILLNARQIFREDIGSRIILLAMEDITKRKQLEIEIQDAREYAENIVETVREPLVVMNSDLKILTANGSFYDTFKVTPEETIGNFIYDLGNRQWDIPKLRILVEEILPLQTVINGYEVEHDFPGIGHKIILLNARQIFREKIGSHIILLAMDDITARKQIESVLHENQEQLQALNEQLEKRIKEEVVKNREKDIILLHADKMSSIGQLAAGVAHEINNPIAFILSNLVTLKRYVETLSDFFRQVENLVEVNCSEEALRLLKEAENDLDILVTLDDINPLIAESLEGANRVKQIVRDLKNFARTDETGFELSDLNACVRSTINLVRNEIKYVSELNLQLGEIPQICCSHHQISQVILNLLVNASHSIKKQGTITVSTSQVGTNVLLSVKDNGCGMSEEVRKRIFEPFYTTKEVGKGTGLGLSISYSIVQKHNGKILVESEPDQGTTFTVILPINNEKELPA